MSIENLIKEHHTEVVKTKDLIFDDKNPNQMSALESQSLEYSLEKWGNVRHVVVDQNNVIADGEHRVRVYLNKKIEMIPVIRYHFKNDTERKLFRQTMNKLHGTHDPKLDSLDILSILESDKKNGKKELMRLLAQENDNDILKMLEKNKVEFDKSIFSSNEETYEDLNNLPDPETISDPIVKKGDIWQLGDHKLLCGDCTKQEDVNRLLNGETVDLLLTDPPYGISIIQEVRSSIGGSKPITIKGHMYGLYRNGNKKGKNQIVDVNTYRPIIGDDKPFEPSHLFGLAKHSILFGANYYANKLPISSCWITWLKKQLEWDRTTFADCELAWTDFDIPARVYSSIWMGLIKEGEHDKRVHPTQKPVKLMMDLIKDFAEENNIILDTYLGSGSTLIACEQTNRKCYGIEIDERYCDVIIKRWENLTGKKAKKL